MPVLNNQTIVAGARVDPDQTAEFPAGLMRRDEELESQQPTTRAYQPLQESARPATLQSLVRDRMRERTRDRATGTGERIVCGSVVCKGHWTPPWKSRLYPNFEGHWACSSRCLWSMVQMATAREVGDGWRDDMAQQHVHRIPLGLVMLAQGWITHPQLRKALDSQRVSGAGRIGGWLVSECGIETDSVTRGLSVQWNCPVLTTERFSPEAMALALPRLFIEKYGILPLRVAGSKILYAGFEDQLDASSVFAVGQMSGLRTECGVVGEVKFREARKLLLECRFAEVTRREVPDRDMLVRTVARVIEQRQPRASRLVRLHQHYWLRIWSEYGASGVSLPSRPGDVSDFLFTIGHQA
jgi:hypothetical protein